MRVATYTQRTMATRGSVFALGVLVLTLLMGTGMVPSIAAWLGGPLERVLTPVWLLLYLLSLGGLMFTQGINWISWLVRYRILLVVLILGTVLSVSWSIDARVSAERTVHLVGSTLIAIFIGFSIPLLTTLRVFALILAVAILASIGAAVAIPELGIQDYEGTVVWRGVFNSKNDLGFWAAVGVLLYITLSDSTERFGLKLLCFLMSSLCLVALAFSQSATSLLALIIAATLSLYFFIAGRFQLGFIRMVMLAVLFSGVVGMAIANIDTAELVGRSGDLTGRGEVWRQVWKLIIERPLTGVGYGSLWFPTDDTIWIQQSLTDFTWVVYHAHNGLLQIASEVGLPLAVIALLMVAQQLIEIFYCQYERQQVGVLFVLAFVTAYLVSNFSEARFLVTRELFWIFFIALPISMLRQINLVQPDPAEQDEDDAHVYPGSAAHAGAVRYGAVAGKPWLKPTPRSSVGGQAAASTPRATVADGAAALMGHNPESPSPDALFDEDRGRAATADTDLHAAAGFDTTRSDTLSLDETDIDLGEMDDTEPLLPMGASADIDLGEPAEPADDDALALPGQESGAPTPVPSDPNRDQQAPDRPGVAASQSAVEPDPSPAPDNSAYPRHAALGDEPEGYDDVLGDDRYDKRIDLSDDEWDELNPQSDR